eukprot:COSAG02_NODE_40431_length_405_cov_1.970588_1_plen_84_part_10
MNEIIAARVAERVAKFDWAGWPEHTRWKVDAFVARRRKAGFTGTIMYQFGWFDDNSQACLEPYSEMAAEIRYATWTEIGWVWEV